MKFRRNHLREHFDVLKKRAKYNGNMESSCQDCTESMEGAESFTLSKQAQTFLVNNAQYTERIVQFEREYAMGRYPSEELEELITNVADEPFFRRDVDYEDDYHTYGNVIYYSDLDKTLTSDFYYTVEDGKLLCIVPLDYTGEITLYGDEVHDTDYYEEPWRDEKDFTLYASSRATIFIPNDPTDYDAYQVYIAAIGDFELN